MKSTVRFVNCPAPNKLKGIHVVVLKVSKGGENFVRKKKNTPPSPRAALREALVSEKLAVFQMICSVCRISSHSCQLLWGFLGRRKVFQCQGLIEGVPYFQHWPGRSRKQWDFQRSVSNLHLYCIISALIGSKSSPSFLV